MRAGSGCPRPRTLTPWVAASMSPGLSPPSRPPHRTYPRASHSVEPWVSRLLGGGASKGKKVRVLGPRGRGQGTQGSARLGRERGAPGTHSARASAGSSGKPEFPPLESSRDRSLAWAEVGGALGRHWKETRLCLPAPPPRPLSPAALACLSRKLKRPESFWVVSVTPLASVYATSSLTSPGVASALAQDVSDGDVTPSSLFPFLLTHKVGSVHSWVLASACSALPFEPPPQRGRSLAGHERAASGTPPRAGFLPQPGVRAPKGQDRATGSPENFPSEPTPNPPVSVHLSLEPRGGGGVLLMQG